MLATVNDANFWLIAADIGLGVAAVLLSVAAFCAGVLWLNDEGFEFLLVALVLVVAAILAAAGSTSLVAA